MAKVNKIKCPACGAEMNHHAEKPNYVLIEPDVSDSNVGGVIEEVHTCPGCGNVELRRAI